MFPWRRETEETEKNAGMDRERKRERGREREGVRERGRERDREEESERERERRELSLQATQSEKRDKVLLWVLWTCCKS